MPNMPKMSVQAIRARSPQQHSLELLKPECVRIVHSCHKNNPCVTRCNGQPLSHQSLPPIWRPPILCYVWEKYAGRQINELCKFNLTRPLGNWELLCIQNWREFKKKKKDFRGHCHDRSVSVLISVGCADESAINFQSFVVSCDIFKNCVQFIFDLWLLSCWYL